MSLVTKSARAIPRCRGCGQPTKGHSGPTGITKCQNQQPDGDLNQNADIGNQNLGTTAVVKPVKVLQSDSTKLEILTEVEGAQGNDETIPFDDPVLIGKIGQCIASLCLEDEADDASKDTETEDKQENALLNPSSEGNSEDFLSQSTLEDLESLLKRDEKQLLRKRVAPARVESSSDSDVDIRKVVAGNSFLLCECVAVTSVGDCATVTSGGDCACKGLLRFNNELQGELVNVFMDPLSEEETDILPSVGSSKSTWEKENPNEIILSVDSVASSGSSSEGEMQMKAFRYVEILKGKKVMSVEVEANIDFSITLNKSCMGDFSSPMTFSKKFKLLEVGNCYDDSTGENSFEEKSSEETVSETMDEKMESSREQLPDVSDNESAMSDDENDNNSEKKDLLDSDDTPDEDDNAHTENEVFCESNEEEDDAASEDDADEGHSETEYDVDEDKTNDDKDEVKPDKVAIEESSEEGDWESINTEDDITEEELDEEVRSNEDESEETSWIEESLNSDIDHDNESEG